MAKSKEIKKTDGRKHNKRLAPKPISTTNKLVKPARTTKAKKDRIASYAVSAMKEEFGSEREFFKYLAQQSKKSFPAMKLFLEYAYGKPSDSIDSDGSAKTHKAPQIHFNIGQGNDKEQIKDIEYRDITDEE